MRIGLVADSFSLETGGIGRYSKELVKRLSNKGVEVIPICVKPLDMPFGYKIDHLVRLPYYTLSKIKSVDLIHATSPVAAISFPFIKKPKIVTYHDLSRILWNKSNTQFCQKISTFVAYKISSKYCSIAIANSAQTKNEIITYLKIPEKKTRTIVIGADEKFQPIKINKKNDYYTIGYVGALIPRKRVDYLIRSFRYLRDKHPEIKVKLEIYGHGEANEYNKLVKLSNILNLCEHVEFKGFAPEDKIVEIYNSFDVFVIPSEMEGFSTPILEAKRCGVPVIVRKDSHIPIETKSGCIVVKSEKDMADKIYNVLTDLNLRKDIVDNGLRNSQAYTLEKTIEETLALYRQLLI